MNISMVESFSDIKSVKMIDKNTIIRLVEEVFRNELKRKFETDENFDIILNPNNGDFEIWRMKTVVNDGEVINDNLEVSLSEVRKIEDDFEVGEEFSEEFKFEKIGRRSILNIKQNLISKFREYNATQTVDKFKDLIGEVYSGEVVSIKRNTVILVDDQGDDITLPRENQIKNEFYKRGTVLSGVIESSEIFNGKALIKISRKSPKYIESLLQEEIPEIMDGIITIKSIVREAGVKSKVVVESYDDRIDPVGICVGTNGSRINSVVRQLNGETIDVINYTSNENLLISRCLKPAKVDSISIEDDVANVYLHPEEIGKAVGKYGVNVKLTSEITGYEINVINSLYEGEDLDDVDLKEFSDEIDEWVINQFVKVGFKTARSVLETNFKDLEEKTDLEDETINDVIRIIKLELDEEV